MKTVLRLLAPWIAVGIFWIGFHNGWLALIAYHTQTILWHRGPWPKPRLPAAPMMWVPALVAAGAGPAFLLLHPWMVRMPISDWLTAHQLSGPALWAMVPVFALLHPYLEQCHWAPLRRKTGWAHVAFAGYHVLVLASLLTPAWLGFCFGVLLAASWMWGRWTQTQNNIGTALLSHSLADGSLILTVLILIR